MENKKTKVIVGLSGGVDSAVALINLINEGYDVEAMFMRNWDSAVNNDVMGNPDLLEDVCPQEKDYMDAVETARLLDIPLHRVDFVEEYWNNVFQYFINEYNNNRTPNPDILCNKEIKFKCFLEKAIELGCDYIAMGHYARIEHNGDKHTLLRGIDRKDIERGQVVIKPGTVQPHTEFSGQVYVLTKEEGGRHAPFFNNYRPQFYFRTTDVTGVITLPEGTDMVMPGDNIDMEVELIHSIALEQGTKFSIREGGRTVGAGNVTEIVE